MKILCFSDSHNESYYMKKAIDSHRDAEVIIFLGDGLSDIEELIDLYPGKQFLLVKGNCDFRSIVMGQGVRKTDEIHLMGKKLVFTHGDLYGAKYGTAGLEKLARERAADIVLFGHTHTPEEIYFPSEECAEDEYPTSSKPYYLFNPGSIGSRTSPTYGIITITEGEPLFSHGRFV